MSFYNVIDTSFLGDFDIKTLQREQELDELEIDLMNYIRDADAKLLDPRTNEAQSNGLSPLPRTTALSRAASPSWIATRIA